ncbi:MAG TPA: tetratricopeptide repeat protein [Bryobacteraceae bacterium]|jgi:tetratricopeptide (TPR) repeat protein
MRLKTMFAILMLCAASGFAQEHMADMLRSGIVAEDSKQDARAAIQQYNAVLKEYAGARETAATALFRMAECYRKQGDRQRAIASYQRVMQEFSDQSKLVARSQKALATYQVAANESGRRGNASDKEKFDQLMAEVAQQQTKAAQAREHYRESLQNEIKIAQEQLTNAQQQNRAGAAPVAMVDEYKAKVAKLQSDLAAFDAGIDSRPSR